MKAPDMVHSSFFSHLSMKREENQGDAVVISVETCREHLLDEDTVGSGVFYTLLDIAMGTAASLAGAAPTATIVLSSTIIDPTPAPFFTCTAKVICSRDGMASAEGWVYRSNQTLAAIGHGDFKLLKTRG
ncbi:hypothetical protein WKH31_14965 [Metabacillus indicus]|uniref:PaaI family thioesterase n=1 Tax=Metabacillus indicus TaxID=246786 RepID=UPI00317EBF0D